ncbi:methyl-accepting chemotaxis protein [Rhodoferax aquaticus]|uniref:HAMP domain-containing protein n=1 Tax=Rhodoferax aquaticus TaxID=2527691 RepID=A0A515EJ76_9BURK|nr:methyl-accepting chemotaxis protein [Rhodoferax aquaticus]QDL52710.1 HAMP domain-containing protein [Rhodoferax aquaticus]
MNVLSLMRLFSIRFRMLGAIAVVLGLLSLLGGAGMLGMFRIQALSQDFIDQTFSDAGHLARLQYELGRVRVDEKEMIIQYEKPEAAKASFARWQASIKNALDQTESFSGGGSGGAVAEEVKKRLRSYEAAFTPVATSLMEAKLDSATAGSALAAKAAAEYAELDKQVVLLEEVVQKEAGTAVLEQERVGNNTKWLFGLAVVVTVAVVVPLTLMNMNSICSPLIQARGVAEAISKGDLSIHIAVDGKDEVADLLRSLEVMRAHLASIVGDLRDASENIASASREIASGNQDLSLRTERAAGNLQTMSATFSGLLDTVQQTASSAREADSLARSASQQALHGGEVVSQVVTSMHGISTSSQKISDIIGLIDSIAFQTNILALNAAVEAARAGEQGRGFAVVASEVRLLAKRSAQSANDIKALISASVTAVDGGVRLAEEAGTEMMEMVSGAQRVGAIIGEISSASAEQASGIGGVNEAVREIEQMTQQNAALVEESAASAESLQEQAARLAEVVRQFTLRTRGGPADPSGPRPGRGDGHLGLS